jgi:putative FmdB family regulatory protein
VPLYEYHCPRCGPFDRRRDHEQATVPMACPTCSAAARRVYTAPATMVRRGPLAGASPGDRARIDRAISGEPTVDAQPGGRRPPRPAHHH